MSLEDDLAKRKEVILRRRALKGEVFKGSAEYRRERKQQDKAVSKLLKERARQDPDQEFMDSHLGLRPSEYQKALDRDLDINSLPKNKDGTVDKRYITSGSWENYPKGVFKKHQNLARRHGLKNKREDAQNIADITLKNPWGGGRPEKQADLSEPDEKNVNKTATNVLANLDLHELPGMYDTAYTPETKLQAVVAWLMTGSVAAAADYASISKNTILKWKKQSPWWGPLAKAIQDSRAEELDASLSNMIHTSMTELADRITHGDYKYNAKLDKAVQIPMAARDLASVIDRMISNRNLLRGDPTSRTENRTTEDNIAFLKTEFKRMGRDTVIIEAEEVDD